MKRVQAGKEQEVGRRWEIHVTMESRKLRLRVGWVRGVVQEALEFIEQELSGLAINELHLLITDDERMRIVNRDFRGKDKPTDVLSFPQFSRKELERARSKSAAAGLLGSYLGDLVIAAETTQRQAERFDVSVQEEFIRLVVHGLLHLCGYDHENVSRAQAERMRRRERKIRKALMIELTPLM